MYRVLIIEPQEFSVNALLRLPVWGEERNGKEWFVCRSIAANGREALDMIRENSFDLILTEINLAIVDGLQLLKQIHKSNQPPLIVFISDIVTFAYAREGFIYGAFDYLPKPVSKHDLEELFCRAANELEKMKNNPYGSSDFSNYCFAPDQINKIINNFCHHNEHVLQSFENILYSFYDTPKARTRNPDLMANKLYSSLIDEIYSRNDWLALYLPRDFHKQIDYLELDSSRDYISFYVRKFTYLFRQYCQLNPEFQDETLAKIHTYILHHPEDDLRLATVANMFYLNHTYLSNLYGRKSNLRYSKLVTLIKMKRAEYLITFTSVPLTEISDQLGYKDFHYFLKNYQNIIGKSPSEYIRGDMDHLNYSI